MKIKEGKAKIVIGARSAIFAPVTNLGIIIIDEEHDSSYKSEANPKYDAKQVAKYIAKQNNCPLVFGSATPDINTYYKAKTLGKIELLELTKRANNSSLPKVSIIDLKQELANGNRSMLSRELYQEIEENLKQKIVGKIDNKARYAIDRCIEEMYGEKAFGLYKFGYVEDLNNIDEKELYLSIT